MVQAHQGIVCSLHINQSFKVKSMYIEQLRNLDLIGQRLLPAIVHLLGLDKGPTSKVVKLWAVDEFYVACECNFAIFRLLTTDLERNIG